MIGSGSAAVLLTSGLACVVSATPAQADPWGGCYSWTENCEAVRIG